MVKWFLLLYKIISKHQYFLNRDLPIKQAGQATGFYPFEKLTGFIVRKLYPSLSPLRAIEKRNQYHYNHYSQC